MMRDNKGLGEQMLMGVYRKRKSFLFPLLYFCYNMLRKSEVVMQLSPEERYKIYEEEKARIDAEQKQRMTAGVSTTGLELNTAGLLCYLGGWITGIVFLVIEQKNQFVRFHALQSIVTFGALTVTSALLNWIPFVGGFFGSVIGILAFILWILLMVKAYQGELYKIPIAGHVAEGILPVTWRGERPEAGEEQKTAKYPRSNEALKPPEPPEVPSPTISEKVEDLGKRVENYFTRTRAGRVTGYSASIFWNVVLLIFFSFFHQYIALYHVEPDSSVTRLSLLTGDYFTWLPILVTALIVSIAANIIMIIYDRYWFREIIQIILTVIGVVVVANLVSIFPFNFSVIPNATTVDIVPVVVSIVLIIIAVGLGVGALVRFIKLIVSVAKQSPS
ncbi:DUF4870 domain-containing protein [Chloroflexota bacterium]